MSEGQDHGWTLVIGGSRGLGAASAVALAGAGHPVVVTYRSDDAAAQRMVGDAAAAGAPWARAEALDLGDPAACEEHASALLAELGPPCAVVLSAARLLRASLAATTVDTFADVITTNCVSPYAVLRTCGLAMADGPGGSLTVLSSMIGPFGVRDRVAYATSKASLLGLTKALAAELAPRVRVNAIVLGTFATDMNAGLVADPDSLRTLESRVPLGRLGTPEEVGRVVELLALRATYVTGAVWEVDGGVTGRLATPSGDPANS